MSINKSEENTSISLETDVLETSHKSKTFDQFFTVYFIAIFVVVVFSLSALLWFISQENKQSQALITEQLAPLKIKLLQQSYLINANKIIDQILLTADANDAITFQQTLSLQSKKLSLLNSTKQTNYQQWFVNNNAAINTITGIETSYVRHELLRHNALIQLDTLLDAIEIHLESELSDTAQRQLLITIQQHFSSLVTKLKTLNLQTSHNSFDQLQLHIGDVFAADYAKQLAKTQPDTQVIADIVRDLIRFEDIILKQDFLAKWAGNLQSMADYHQQLTTQQQQLLIILDSLANNNDQLSGSPSIAEKQLMAGEGISLLVLSVFSLTLLSIIVILWLIKSRIKASTLYAASCIKQALEGENTAEILEPNKGGFRFYNLTAISTETEVLLAIIHEINAKNYSEFEYLALTDKNQALAEQIAKDKTKKEQLTLELELVNFNASAKSKSQLLLEQQRCRDLHLAAIKQLVLLGSSAVTTKAHHKGLYNENSDENYLYKAHLQGRDLVRKLRQASCSRYLQSSDAVLTLNDVNLVSQVEAILFNLRHKLLLCDNTISVSIDKNIMSSVNLDAELFSEMFRTYISLLFSKQSNRSLELYLSLVDKNNGQQKVCFTGHIQGGDNPDPLPKTLQSFSDTSIAQSELGDYFSTLSGYQHGENISASATDSGYQLSFTIPFAVSNNNQAERYSLLSLPGDLTAIEQTNKELAATYVAMPIEVLLAVNTPKKYQRLQQLLQSMGLQVTFVTCEVMQQKNWESGRFAVLMTELDCIPFTRFMIDEGDKYFGQVALARGVFSLSNTLNLANDAEEYLSWVRGSLSAESTVAALTKAMLPWIKEHTNEEVLPATLVSTRDNVNDEFPLMDVLDADSSLMPREQLNIFNFDRYIANQGSAELALFMLAEYTSENTTLVTSLAQAFTLNEVNNIGEVIQRLHMNANILAADHLSHLCQRWRQLVNENAVDNSEINQLSLLTTTEQAVLELYQCTEAVA